MSKCVFGVTEVQYLGYTINKGGSKPLEDKVEAIQQMHLPRTVKELRRFLGIINFYRRFIRNAAQHQVLLNAYTPSPTKLWNGRPKLRKPLKHADKT